MRKLSFTACSSDSVNRSSLRTSLCYQCFRETFYSTFKLVRTLFTSFCFNSNKRKARKTTTVTPLSILVPRGCDPFGQRHGSSPLAGSNPFLSLIGQMRTQQKVINRKRNMKHGGKTPTNRTSAATCVCKGNIISKNHPLDLLGRR